MCNFAVDLATSILNLEIRKNRILEKDSKTKRLCHCRREILKSYIKASEMLFVRTTARIMKFIDDHNPQYASIHDPDELREWFRSATYSSMYSNPCVSNKMVVVFKLLQEVLDDHFFDFFQEKYEKMINEMDPSTIRSDSKLPVVRDFLNEMSEWLEASVFNILSIRIDCRHISDEIYSDYYVPRDTQCCTLNNELGNCSSCVFVDNKMTDCSSQHDLMVNHGEDIHLYIVEEMLGTEGWMSNFFTTINKYHTNIQNVYLILDFSLLETDQIINQKNIDAINKAKEIFCSVSFLGYARVKNINEVI